MRNIILLLLLIITHPCYASEGNNIQKLVKQLDAKTMAADPKLEKASFVSDEIFVRRIYLDLCGRIPYLEETKTFLADKSIDKRSKLIDQLLQSEDYHRYMYHFWADMLRIQSRIKGIFDDQYANWVKDSIKENKPYDQMVKELINATGKINDNGAIGYYLRDEGNTLETASTTSQIFLGTQIGCAQCHDHAFEDWTQLQFYEFASYMGQVRTKANNKGAAIRKKFRDNKDISQREANVIRQIIENASFNIHDLKNKQLRLPKDYKYDNAKPNEVVNPKVFFGNQPEIKEGQSRREALANWLTAKDNPLFTKIIANRLWKRLMGKGLFEPIDDYNESIKVFHPEVLKNLESMMQAVNFDLKEFTKIVVNSKAYQMPTSSKEIDSSEYPLHVRGLKRMKAEQIWNSLITLNRKDINQSFSNGNFNYDGMKELIEKVQKGEYTFENTESLLTSVRENIKEEQEKRKKIKKEQKAESKKNEGMLARDDSMKMQQEAKSNKIKNAINIDKLAGRSSEIMSPAPESHLLNYFGQSDREIIEEGHLEPSLPQVLALLNSNITTRYVTRVGELRKIVNDEKNVDKKIEMMYLAMFSRYPTEKEKKLIIEFSKKDPRRATEDVIWVLINKREFIFIQ